MKQSFDKGFITPHPVFIIATYDENGKADAMNAAWVGQIGGNQISMSLSPHRTTKNIKLNKEFTVSFATKEQVDLEKLHPIMFDTVALCYREIGENVGGAWKAGKKFE